MPATRQSRQPLTVTRLDLQEINDAFQRIQEALDVTVGVGGAIVYTNSVQYADSNGQVLHGWGAKP